MLGKLKERRDLLASEHADLLIRHTSLGETARTMANKLNMLVGHVSEIDFQIKALEREDNGGQELDKGCDKPEE